MKNLIEKNFIQKICVLLFLTLITCYLSLYAAFLDPGWGGRATAMGGAYTSISSDAEGVIVNPAGSVAVRRFEANFSYCKPFYGLDLYSGSENIDLGMQFASVVKPLSFGSVGVAYSSIMLKSLYSENIYCLNVAVRGSDLKRFVAKFQNSDESLNFGTSPKKKFRAKEITTSYGINFKYLRHSYTTDEYTANDPVFFNGDSASAISLDLGMLLKYGNLSTGIVFKDLNSPDVGLDSQDNVPMEIRLGSSYKFKKILPSLDLSLRDKLFNLHFGCEYSMEILRIRTGVNMDELSAGFGLDMHSFSLAYSFIWPLGISESYGTHRLALSLRMGTDKSGDNQYLNKKQADSILENTKKRSSDSKSKVSKQPKIKKKKLPKKPKIKKKKKIKKYKPQKLKNNFSF